MLVSPIAWTILTFTAIILLFCIYLPIKHLKKNSSSHPIEPHHPTITVPSHSEDQPKHDSPTQPIDLTLLQNQIRLYPQLVDLLTELMEAHTESVTIPFLIDTLLNYNEEDRLIIINDTLEQIHSFEIHAIPILTDFQRYRLENHLYCSNQLRYRIDQLLAIAPFAANLRVCEEHYLYFLNLIIPTADQPIPKYHPALFWTICRLIHHLFDYALLLLATQLRKEIDAILDEQNPYQPEIFNEIDTNIPGIELLIWQIGAQLK